MKQIACNMNSNLVLFTYWKITMVDLQFTSRTSWTQTKFLYFGLIKALPLISQPCGQNQNKLINPLTVCFYLHLILATLFIFYKNS